MVRFNLKLLKRTSKSSLASGSRGFVRRLMSHSSQKTHELLQRAEGRVNTRSKAITEVTFSVLESLKRDRELIRFDPLKARTHSLQTDPQRSDLYLAIVGFADAKPLEIVGYARSFLEKARQQKGYAKPEQVQLVERMIGHIEQEKKALDEASKRRSEFDRIHETQKTYSKVRSTPPLLLMRILRGGPKLWRRIPDAADLFKRREIGKLNGLSNAIVHQNETIHAQELEVARAKSDSLSDKGNDWCVRFYQAQNKKLDLMYEEREALEGEFNRQERVFHQKTKWRYNFGAKFRRLFGE